MSYRQKCTCNDPKDSIHLPRLLFRCLFPSHLVLLSLRLRIFDLILPLVTHVVPPKKTEMSGKNEKNISKRLGVSKASLKLKRISGRGRLAWWSGSSSEQAGGFLKKPRRRQRWTTYPICSDGKNCNQRRWWQTQKPMQKRCQQPKKPCCSKKPGTFDCFMWENEHLQMDRGLVEKDDRKFIFQWSRELPNKAGFEPIKLLQWSLAVILERHPKVRDATWLVDVSEGRKRRRDPKYFMDEFYSFQECKMLVLDEKLLAANRGDLLLAQLPATIFGFLILQGDGFHKTSSLMLGEELPDGTLRSMYHGRDFANWETLLTKTQDFLLRKLQHSLEDPLLWWLLVPLKLNFVMWLLQQPKKFLKSSISNFRTQLLRDPEFLQLAWFFKLRTNFNL